MLLLTLAGAVPAQPGPGGGPGVLFGRIYDSDLNVPVEYANVVLYRQRDSSQATGGVTDATGRFELAGVRPGRYWLEVTFIGYRSRRIEDIQFAAGARLDLGRIDLRQTAVAVEGAEVVADRPTLSYRIDKKVIDVSRLTTAASGTAVDVLENAPSVKVDV